MGNVLSVDVANGIGSKKRVNLRAIARYSLLPGIIPRIRALGFHFGHFAYLIALVLNSTRLIPDGHPALNPVNIGRYGVRQVLAVAANHINWSRRNIDQIAIFSAIVIGILMIAVQAALIAAYAVMGTAHAQGADSYFSTPNERVPTDVVLIFLEQVFGPNLQIFGTATEPTGTPVYLGLQKILGIYSTATMVIAVIIVLYYVLTVIAEAAQTGTPFGRRFNSVWAPIRLVVALGLLVPLGTGLNSAQYITLWTAKMGSGLGTKLWTEFATNMTSANNVISKPASQSTISLVSQIFLNEVCAAAYNQMEEASNHRIKVVQVTGNTTANPSFTSPATMIEAAKASGMGHVEVSWNSAAAGRPADYACGRILVSLADFDFYARSNGGELVDQNEGVISYGWSWLWGGREARDKIGKVHSQVRAAYIGEIGRLSEALREPAEKIAAYKVSVGKRPSYGDWSSLSDVPGLLKAAATTAQQNINTVIETTYESLTDTEYARSDDYEDMISRGWGAAGLWYANIAKINQKYMEAISAAAPTMGTLVENGGNSVFENEGLFGLGRNRFGLNGDVVAEIEYAMMLAENEFIPYIASGVSPDSPLYQDARIESAHKDSESGFAWAILGILGGSQLYDMKNNPSLDPMAHLAGAGHSMVNRSIAAFLIGGAMVAGGAKLRSLPAPMAKFIGELAGAAAGLFFTLAAIGATAGVFLAYVIPLLPFVYFALAAIGWVLEIFEAIVAMPLWALAHLRIDGDGMPGGAALGGYQLLLMILLRPAFIVFGLIGGYVIFGAAIYYFSTLYNSATSISQQELVGSSPGWIGVFVFTILFAFFSYNIAIMCFKMIDDVPKGILRWLGASAQTFADSRSDPISGGREMTAGIVGATAAMSAKGQSAIGDVRKAWGRRNQRKAGVDPDDIIQKVQVVPSRGGPSAPKTDGDGSGYK